MDLGTAFQTLTQRPRISFIAPKKRILEDRHATGLGPLQDYSRLIHRRSETKTRDKNNIRKHNWLTKKYSWGRYINRVWGRKAQGEEVGFIKADFILSS